MEGINRGWFTPFASLARTATHSSSVLTFPSWSSGLWVVTNCTSITAAPSVVLSLQGWCEPLATAYEWSVTSSMVATGHHHLTIKLPSAAGDAPTFTGASTIARKSQELPQTFILKMTHANADSITYSTHYQFLAQ